MIVRVLVSQALTTLYMFSPVLKDLKSMKNDLSQAVSNITFINFIDFYKEQIEIS